LTTDPKYLQSTRCEGYQHLEIDYAEKKNAMSPAFFGQLRDAIAAAERDPEVRAVLLSGRGELFCGGADLDVFKDNPFPGGFSASPIYHCIVEMLRCEKPIVAAVQGAAVGGGATLLLSCDIVVAAEGTKFLFPFSQLGINAELGASYLLPLTVGMRYAAKWLLLAESVGSEEALQAGLVTDVVSADQLLPTAERYVSRLTQLVPRSLRTNKRLLRHAHAAALQGVLMEEFKGLEVGFSSEEMQEAVAAFKGKRTADFSRFS
jgi:enoyl-CoA hydratase/carnithine racemase